MGLGADYRRTTDRATLFGAIEVVGSPSIGPPAFMHRPSASENPQAPLSHHHMDSTHVTPGVVRGGVTAGEWRTEASWFRGREPDENRMDLDLGAARLVRDTPDMDVGTLVRTGLWGVPDGTGGHHAVRREED